MKKVSKHIYGKTYSPGLVSRFNKELGEALALWRKRMGSVQAVIFDITSLSSYSELIEYLEWGYNRDKDHLPLMDFTTEIG